MEYVDITFYLRMFSNIVKFYFILLINRDKPNRCLYEMRSIT